MNANVIIGIVFLHWFFDFFLQTHQMATEKSKSFNVLTDHTIVYSLMAFCVGFWLNMSLDSTIDFFAYLFVTHTAIDFVTSKITSYLWKKQKFHWFFTVIGFDQFLHYATIFWFFHIIKY